MTAFLTPDERAAQALENAEAFCNLLAAARAAKAAHTWEGSAFRSHPCGLIVETIKFTNYWHVDDLGNIVITDGAGWDRHNVCRDPQAHGDPHPKPVAGGALTVWRNGRWERPEYRAALYGRVLAILAEAAEHVERFEAARQRAQDDAHVQTQAALQQLERRALTKAAGSAA